MGKTTRWLKSVFGMKEKEKNPTEHSNSDKKRWSFAKSEKDNVNANYSHISTKMFHATDAAWLSSYENVQNEHAVAVAAATAVAAEAAMAAAQAAAAVVKLTSNARGTLFGGRKDYKWAAVKIQSVFRGYLSRKALRALKGLVRLQALVRGYLVRKRAAATLHSMQALFRAQSSVRSQRLRRSFDKENRYRPENRPRKSIERFDEPRSGFHSKRLLSTSIDTNVYDDNPKTVEIDTLKTRSRSYRFNVPLSECGDDFHHQTIPSPIPRPVPARASLPSYQNLDDFDWCFNDVDECRFSSAQNTPRFVNAPTTPTKSVCGDGDGYFRSYSNSNCPSYMMNTQSFRAKLRYYSAPKQRPESGVAKKRLSLNEIMAARNSMSGVRMNKTCYKVQECLEL